MKGNYFNVNNKERELMIHFKRNINTGICGGLADKIFYWVYLKDIDVFLTEILDEHDFS